MIHCCCHTYSHSKHTISLCLFLHVRQMYHIYTEAFNKEICIQKCLFNKALQNTIDNIKYYRMASAPAHNTSVQFVPINQPLFQTHVKHINKNKEKIHSDHLPTKRQLYQPLLVLSHLHEIYADSPSYSSYSLSTSMKYAEMYSML